jgi:NTE family protein
MCTEGKHAAQYANAIAPYAGLPSVEIDGRRLSDGVVSNPLPVSVAHDARAVIALGFRGVMPRPIDR